jgi:hypothetical protein
LKRLKQVPNLERTSGLRMAFRRSWGWRRFWQLLRLLLAMRSSHKKFSLVPLQIRSLELRIGCKV